MPLLAERSLWEGTSTNYFPNLTLTPVVTCTVQNIMSEEGQVQIITLFSQIAETGAVTDLPGTVTLTLRAPDNSTQTFTPTIGTLPGISHTSGSGKYQLSLGQPLTGRYGFTWYVAGQSIWSGEFHATQVAAP
jgi:hypothetical protein